VKHTVIWVYTLFALVSFVPIMGQSTASRSSTSGNANNAITDSLSGSGTPQFVPLWLGHTTLGDFNKGPDRNPNAVLVGEIGS
jgi:hypothetical protein